MITLFLDDLLIVGSEITAVITMKRTLAERSKIEDNGGGQIMFTIGDSSILLTANAEIKPEQIRRKGPGTIWHRPMQYFVYLKAEPDNAMLCVSPW